jgi:tetratricopeptide (TPR) repeat protein
MAASCHTALGVGYAQAGQRSRAEREFAAALEAAARVDPLPGDPNGAGRLAERVLLAAEAQEAWAGMLLACGEAQAAEQKLMATAQARADSGLGSLPWNLPAQPLGLYAQVNYVRGKLPEAMKLEEQALKEAEAAKDVAGQAEALAALAALYHESGKSEDGLRAGEKAAELTKQLGSKEAEAIEKGLRPLRRSATSDWAAALRRSAQAKYRAGDFQGAIKLLRQAQKMDETLGRKLAVVDDLNGIAACQLAQAVQGAAGK